MSLTPIVRSGKADGDRSVFQVVMQSMSPFNWLILVWFVFGQLLMLTLLSVTIGDGAIKSLIDFVSSTIPNVASVKSAKIFNGEIGRQHHALIWLMSFPLLVAIVFLPADKKEIETLKKDSSNPILLSTIFLGLALASAVLDFYTGFYSFGLTAYPWGFSLISSLSTLAMPFSVRFMALVFQQNNTQLKDTRHD